MVWLILPAYNEVENLPSLLERVITAWHGLFPFHVVVVDDGSTDDTASVAHAAGSRGSVEVLRHPQNRGLPAAIRTGVQEVCRRAADEDVIVTMDADNSHSPELVPSMVALLQAGSDIVIASRFVRGGREEGVAWTRRLWSRGARIVFSVLFPIPGVRDYTTGFRAYRAVVLKTLCAKYGERVIEAGAFSVMTELLLKARVHSPKVTEVPLVLRYDLKQGPSKMKLGKTLKDYARLVLREMRPRGRKTSSC